MNNNKKIYLPGINGLRALAAFSVLFSHIGEPFLNLNISVYNFHNGFDGVTLFFVISGFLITYLLIEEKINTNKIIVSKFYVRRILRIWPIYYLVLIISILLIFFSENLFCNYKEIPYYVFFAANVPFILGGGIELIVHYWSIGVEEQFYLFWPWIIKYTNIKSIFVKVLLIVFFIYGFKLFIWYFFGVNNIYRVFVVDRFHCMMIGALGAILWYTKNNSYIKLTTNLYVQISVWFIWIIMTFNIIHFPSVINSELVSLISLVLIMGQIENKGFIKLENDFFDFLGKISYGIYVIHPITIFLISNIIIDFSFSCKVNTVLLYLLVPITTVIFAYISYTYFESYFLKLKTKYMVIKSVNSKVFVN